MGNIDKDKLKQLLKPIIKECVEEYFAKNGLISSIISEAIKGTMSAYAPPQNSQLSNSRRADKEFSKREQEMEELEQQAREKRKKLAKLQQEQKRKILAKTGIPQKLFDETEAKMIEDDGGQVLLEEETPRPKLRSLGKSGSKSGGDDNKRSERDPKVDNLLNNRGIELDNIVALIGGLDSWHRKM